MLWFVVILAVAAQLVLGDSESTSYRFNVKNPNDFNGFDNLTVSSGLHVDVTLVTGRDHRSIVNITAPTLDLINALVVDRTGDSLRDLQISANNLSFSDRQKIHITAELGVRPTTDLEVHFAINAKQGSTVNVVQNNADVSLQLSAESGSTINGECSGRGCYSTIKGSGSINVHGSASTSVTVTIQGSGIFNGQNLQFATSNYVQVDGAALLSLNATRIEGYVHGSAVIRHTDDPPVDGLQINGFVQFIKI